MCAVVLAIAMGTSLAAPAPPKPERGPLNPDFVEFLRAHTLSRATVRTAAGHALGEVPPPVGASTIRPNRRILDRGPLPPSYDLRTPGNKLSAVRDQGGCGSCWAFATYGALES